MRVGKSVSLRISGEQDWAEQTEKRIMQEISSYSNIAEKIYYKTLGDSFIFLMTFCFILAQLLINSVIDKYYLSPAIKNDLSLKSTLDFLIFVSVFVIFAATIYTGKLILPPRQLIIGRYARNYSRRTAVVLFFFGNISGGIVSYIVNIFYGLWGPK